MHEEFLQVFDDKFQARDDGRRKRKISLLILDANFRRRAAITASLDPERHYAVPIESLAELNEHPAIPDCVLLADEDGMIEAVNRHYARFGTAPTIIAYADGVAPERVVRAVKNGATNYLGYPFSQADFERSLLGQSDGPGMASDFGAGHDMGARNEPLLSRLTRRETEVLRMVSQGSSSQQISDLLQISRRTVEVHRANILAKLHARNSIDAVNIANRLRLI